MSALTQVQRVLALAGNTIAEYVGVIVGGAANAFQLVALNASGQLDLTMMPTGIGPDTQVLAASEAIAAGALVKVYANGGVATMRNANGGTGLEADGFVLAAVAQGANGTAYLSGLNTAVSGLTPGLAFLSDTTIGGVAAAGATTPGHIYQQVGVVTAAGALQFAPGPAITRS